MDIGCKNWVVIGLTTCRSGFGSVVGFELIEEVSEIARKDTRNLSVTVVNCNALETEVGSFDVIALFRPFAEISEYPKLIARCKPTWMLLVNHGDLQVAGFSYVFCVS